MRLTILGCSGSIPGPDTAASGYLLEAEGFRLGLELGNGAFAQLQRVLDPFDLDALLLSHLHSDHCADVNPLTVLRRYHPAPPYPSRPQRLPLYAPPDAPSRLGHAYAADADERASVDLSDVYEFHALREETVQIGPFDVTAAAVYHPTPAFGLRITYGGSILAYTGDTGKCRALGELADGVDVLLSEASWTDAGDRPEGVHLSGKEAAELAKDAGVGRLLLTHIAPWTDRHAVLAEAQAVFPAAELVAQGAVYDI
ncbi:MBL fold metallo-hydrolase [Amycolatopsis jiangsuensis]|uniref:Ribonuclease BN (tRNA processing enzyme) n=1 Tax=Amycolatopsis jiangsuensis TaxID=1181879 RepID=A0A840J635_9PSEU|nr:MBL fold metallo-hydrolase [Amycolatopsis jiangsuensis]MBB4688868.1 ribonuclease BN (tRNA processing enzyme) [Amycolatopsis jiangsuensis]